MWDVVYLVNPKSGATIVKFRPHNKGKYAKTPEFSDEATAVEWVTRTLK